MTSEITPHIISLHIDLPWFPQPYPPNVFLIRDGGEATLIDSGFSDDDSYDKRIALLRELGIRTRDGAASARSTLKYIILTHHHYDHASGAYRLREATGARIVVHRDEEALLLSPEDETGDMEIPEDQQEARARAKQWREDAAKATPDVRVADGDVLHVGALHLRCLHTPGHTAGHLCIFLEEERALFAGDNVLGVGTAAISPPPHGDMAEYIRSLHKMQALDAALLLPGHGPVVREPNRKIQELIDHRRQREDQIVALIAQGRDSVKTLVNAIYPELDKRLRGMATGQIISHLHKLQSESKLRLEGKGEEMRVVGRQ